MMTVVMLVVLVTLTTILTQNLQQHKLQWSPEGNAKLDSEMTGVGGAGLYNHAQSRVLQHWLWDYLAETMTEHRGDGWVDGDQYGPRKEKRRWW